MISDLGAKALTLSILAMLCVSGAFVIANDDSGSDATINATDGLDYTVTNGCLVISGTGPMQDYTSSANLGTLYTFTTCIIESGVTSIGANAFCSCSTLTSVIISDSVTFIGDNAFKYCSNVISVTFEGLQPTFGSYSFYLGYYGFYANAIIFTTGWGSLSVFTSDIIASFTGLIFEPITHTISFDVGTSDVVVPASQTITSGSCATVPDLTVDGFTVSWYSDSGLTIPFDFTSVITANTTLYLGLTVVPAEIPAEDTPSVDDNDNDDPAVPDSVIMAIFVIVIAILALIVLAKVSS